MSINDKGKLALVVLVIALTVCLTVTVFAYRDRVNRRDAKIHSLKETCRKLENDYSDLNSDYKKLQDDYSTLSIKHENLQRSHRDLLKDYQSLKDNYSELKFDYERLRDKHENLQEKYEKVKIELKELRSGNRYELHDPTYEELKNFLAEDTTDENEWTEGYDCTEFSRVVNLNATKAGIQCAYVEMDFQIEYREGRIENGAHAIVAFRTIDRGLVFVEPQNDAIVPELQVGDSYWDVVEEHGDVNYLEWPKSWIQKIAVIW